MKALVKFAPGDGNVEIREVPEPSCGKDQIKLEIGFCGVCGTDIHVLHDKFRNYPPVILGHEFAGTVVEVGKNVEGIVEGDRGAVLGATAVTCGKCQYCISGNFIFCPNRRGMGHGVNGAFARYVVVRPDQFYRVPEHLAMEEAALSEPFAAAIQAVNEMTRVRIGDTALVSGPGPMGLLCLKLLVAEGIKTIVAGAEGDDFRFELFASQRGLEVLDENAPRDAVDGEVVDSDEQSALNATGLEHAAGARIEGGVEGREDRALRSDVEGVVGIEMKAEGGVRVEDCLERG